LEDKVQDQLKEFFILLGEIENSLSNITNNLLIIKLYLETLNSYLQNLEYPYPIIFYLIKNEKALKTIESKFKLFAIENEKLKMGEFGGSFDNLILQFQNISNILDRFKTILLQEGVNLEFMQELEVKFILILIGY
jgi:hypothetical protein